MRHLPYIQVFFLLSHLDFVKVSHVYVKVFLYIIECIENIIALKKSALGIMSVCGIKKV